MSIATRTGDAGTTGLMYNRRVPKTHPRIQACGAIDELNAALGLARASRPALNPVLLPIQHALVGLMGEVATEIEDLPRYAADGYQKIESRNIEPLDRLVRELESKNINLKGWATPGETLGGAALDLARTACRRAERHVCALAEAGALENSQILVFLNRLSDVLWLLARQAETEQAESAGAQPIPEQAPAGQRRPIG